MHRQQVKHGRMLIKCWLPALVFKRSKQNFRKFAFVL